MSVHDDDKRPQWSSSAPIREIHYDHQAMGLAHMGHYQMDLIKARPQLLCPMSAFSRPEANGSDKGKGILAAPGFNLPPAAVSSKPQSSVPHPALRPDDTIGVNETEQNIPNQRHRKLNERRQTRKGIPEIFLCLDHHINVLGHSPMQLSS
ncbi:hypothetical protein BP5796_05245 [Coleophoma crateriformis]|uniref:Uncharacterized protein n=1 Tax=Coleophoma crateriformis TaxID=565419 RepID=A0A3D8S2L5_9HELO|nr:hypothetical protein BP5796_05245 [Coleophoma crateriformis]